MAVAGLAVILTILFSSPDDPPTTIQSWAKAEPGGFLATAVTELNGTSDVATYGPPYTNTSGVSQEVAGISPAEIVGVHIPIDTAKDYVIDPLKEIPADPRLKLALAAYQAAPPKLQEAWAAAYEEAVPKARFVRGVPLLPPGRYGPVATMMGSLLGLAQSGGLDGALVAGNHRFYETNYTKPLLYPRRRRILRKTRRSPEPARHAVGNDERDRQLPGQVWLWLYTFWYQIEPFKSSENADLLVFLIMGVLSLALVCIPFIPGLRSLPRHLRVYRLIWRDHYREVEG